MKHDNKPYCQKHALFYEGLCKLCNPGPSSLPAVEKEFDVRRKKKEFGDKPAQKPPFRKLVKNPRANPRKK